MAFMGAISAVILATDLHAPALAQDADGAEQDQPAEPQAETRDSLGFDFERLYQATRPVFADRPDYDTSKPVVGFGISAYENGMRIEIVLEGSAAESAGLKTGMVILRTNGITMKGFEVREVVKILGAIDGEIILDVEGEGRFSLIKAPIAQTPSGDSS